MDSPERSFTVESNVEKYGTFINSENYRTINDEDQAVKTATFWSIRESNTWRSVKFTTTLEHMNLELFDCVTLSVPSFPTIKVVISLMNVDPSNGTVRFEAWTPILSGTTEKYSFAWPSDIANIPYPNNDFQVVPPAIAITPPVGHPLYIEDNAQNPAVPPTTGDRFPSDTDDGWSW